MELEETMLLKSLTTDTNRAGSGGAYVVAQKLPDEIPECVPLHQHWDYVTFAMTDDASNPHSLFHSPVIDNTHRLTLKNGHFVNSLGVALDAGNPSRGQITAGGLVAAFQVRGMQTRQLWAMQPVDDVEPTLYDYALPCLSASAKKPMGFKSKSAPGRLNRTEEDTIVEAPLLLKRLRSDGTKDEVVPEPEWRRLALGALSKQVLNGTYKLNERTLKKLLQEHKVKPNADLLHFGTETETGDVITDGETDGGDGGGTAAAAAAKPPRKDLFGKCREYDVTPATWKQLQHAGQCLICLEVKNGSIVDDGGSGGGGGAVGGGGGGQGVANPCEMAGIKVNP